MIILCTWVFPLLLGASLLKLVDVGRHGGAAWVLMKVGLAIGLGIGVASLHFYFWIEKPQAYPWRILGGEGCIVLFFWILSLSKKSHRMHSVATIKLLESEHRIANGLLVFAVGMTLMALLFISVHLYRFPHGDWDAWSFWTLRAKFVFLGETGWDEMFRLPGYFHPDYPLMTTSFVARNWAIQGQESLVVCYVISVGLFLGSVFVPAMAIAILRNRLLASVAVVSILLPVAFLVNAARLMADTPLAFYTTGAVVCFSLGSRMADGRGWFLLSGILVGMAAWTKSEGLLWFVCFMTILGIRCLCMENWKCDFRRGYLMFAGAIPSLFVLYWFKTSIPYDEIPYLIPRFSVYGIGNLLNLDRLIEVFVRLFQGVIGFGGFGLLAYGIFLWLCGLETKECRNASIPMLLGVLFLVAIGYVVAFVVSLNSAVVEVPGATDRLLTHLWPSFVYLTLMASKLGLVGEEQLTLNPVSQ